MAQHDSVPLVYTILYSWVIDILEKSVATNKWVNWKIIIHLNKMSISMHLKKKINA